MSKTTAVIVVGSFVQDLTWRCPDFPSAGQTTVGTFSTGPGGKGSNQAVACGRAGVDTLYVGAAGDDAFADQALRFYAREKIGCRITRKSRQPTGTAAILVNAEGQNEIVVALGANDLLRKSDVPTALIKQARVVVTQLESNLATTLHVLKTARRAGVTTLLNPAPMRPDFPISMLGFTDILIPNETEFTSLVRMLPGTGCPGFTEKELLMLSETDLQSLCRKIGVPAVIVTLGSRGCFVSLKDGGHLIPACKGIKVVDTTGAGDAFVGGFAAGLIQHGKDILTAARFGNAVAALSVTQHGTAPAMPRAKEIAAFLKSRGALPAA